MSASAVKQLGELGVVVRTGTRVTAIDAQGVSLTTADGTRERIESESVVWGAGVAVSPIARSLGCRSTSRGA